MITEEVEITPLETAGDIIAFIKPITWLSFSSHGYACGYIGLPKGHLYYGTRYDDIPYDTHHGLTYSASEVRRNKKGRLEKYWVIGFDTCHFMDNAIDHDREFCIGATMELLTQAEADQCKEPVL